MLLLIKYLLRLWRGRAGAPSETAGSRRQPTASRAVTRRRATGLAGWLALLVHQVGYDVRISLRNPRARFFTFIFPLVLLVIFTGVFGHGTTKIDGVRVSLSHFYVTGILALSIVVAAYGNLVISISTWRESGVLKRRRSTPVPPSLLILGQACATMVVVTIMSSILLLVGKFAYGVGMAPAALLAIACIAVIGTLALACVGFAVSGMIGSPDAAQPVVQATMMPLWFLSGVFIPLEKISPSLRTVGSLFPVEHLADALQRASVHSTFVGALSPGDLLVLAAWGVAAAGFAAWRFSWLPSTATA